MKNEKDQVEPTTCKKEPSESDGNYKKKGKNWSKSEEGILIDLIADKRDIIESKATNRTFKNLNLKNQAWKEVFALYNNNLGVNHRSIEQLKSKWDNLKTSAKKRSDALKRHLNQTGAAPNPKLNLSPNEEKILGIMMGAFDPIKNEYDSDNAIEEKETKVEMTGCVSPVATVIDLEEDSRPEGQLEETDDMETATRKRDVDVMKTPGNSGTAASKRPKTQAQTLNQLRMDYMELQKTLLLERHQRYMQLMDTLETCARETSRLREERPEHSQLQDLETNTQLADLITQSFGVISEDN